GQDRRDRRVHAGPDPPVRGPAGARGHLRRGLLAPVLLRRVRHQQRLHGGRGPRADRGTLVRSGQGGPQGLRQPDARARPVTDTVPFLTAFAAGLASFVSPCVLPIVPGYLSFISGVNVAQLRDGEAPPHLVRQVVITS